MKKLKLLLFCLLSVTLLVGCSASDKTNKTVTSFFEAYKKLATPEQFDGKQVLQDTAMEEEILKYIDESSNTELKRVIEGFTVKNEDTQTLVTLVTQDLHYKILSTTVQDDTAVVKVVVDNTDLQQFMHDYMTQYFTYITEQSNQADGTAPSQGDLNTYAHDLLSEKIAGDKKKISASFDIVLKDLEGDGWKIVSDENLINAITGNYYTFLKSLGDITEETAKGSVPTTEREVIEVPKN